MNRIHFALDSIARREIPENADLWPQIVARIERKDTVKVNPRLKLAWMIMLVLLGLALATTAVYALVHYFTDPGMRSVSDTGLITNLNITSAPAAVPTATPLPPAAVIGTSQTLHGITLTMDWVYLDDMWQSMGFSATGVGDDQTFGQPLMRFGKITLGQYSGAALSLTKTETGLAGKYVVYQPVHDDTDMASDTFADVSIEIPLLDAEGRLLETFRFSGSQVQVHRESYYGGNTYATRVNGLEMRLEWIIFSPKNTRARLCYDRPGLKLESTTLQWGQAVNAPALPSQQIVKIDAGCVEAIFPADTQDSKAFTLVVNNLKDENNVDYPGPWIFNWLVLPQHTQIPGITPLESQTAGSYKVTLVQAYADAARMVVVLRIEGIIPDWMFTDVTLKDLHGDGFNGGYDAGGNPDDPALYTLTFYPTDLSHTPQRFQGQLTITFNARGQQSDQAPQAFTFDLDLPVYPAKEIKVGQVLSSNGLEMRLETLKITPSYTFAYLCFQKPDARDWYFSQSGTSLQIGETQSNQGTASLLFDSNPGSWMINSPDPEWVPPIPSGRCILVGFPLGYHQKTETLTLSIDGLELSMPGPISNDQVQAARQKLRKQGIEMDWITQSGNGGGGASPQITKKPVGMTDDEVMRRFYEALGYFYKGKWVFSVEIQP
jgi:hypothetical protein